MPALGVVKTLQVAEDTELSLLAGLIVGVFDLLSLQSSEERLDDSVVITVPAARHTLRDVVGFELGPKSMTSILGGFNRSLQHLGGGELWEGRRAGAQRKRAGRRCGRQDTRD